mmetsp:Transcript_4970/g.14522  ORF Transcript_4970/g.14522 Transcript_4970/m.14522 type:complete len:781 (-) Transcript_4970:69-2411(-)
MGSCETRDKEETCEPADRSLPSSTCWERATPRSAQGLEPAAAALREREERELARLRSEASELKRENRVLRERLASCLAQLEGPEQVPTARKPRSPRDNSKLTGSREWTPERTGRKHVEFADADREPGQFVPGRNMAEDPELLNSLIKEVWEFVSLWFENKMRQDVERAIQNVMPAGIGFQFGDACNLGRTPMTMHAPVTTTYMQPGSSEGEDIENVRIVGELQYHGDCRLEASVSAGKVMVTDLTLAGAIVIELIRMVPRPPFFSGIRLYFPNPPEVDLQVESAMLGLNMSFAFIRGTIIQALSGVIAKSVVLPNRFAFTFAKDLDPFPLRHPRPQGVLRVAVLEARGLRDPGRMLSVDPFVAVSVGSTTWSTPPAKGTLSPRWDGSAVHDFFVMDRLAQVLRVEVRDADNGYLGSQALKKSDFLGRVEATIADLVDAQHGSVPCERWLELGADGREGLGEVRLQVQWRPLANVKNLSLGLASNPEENCWTLGKKETSTWVLFIGVYAATMLPPAPDGTRHWVSVAVAEAEGGGELARVETVAGRSLTPVQKDLEALCHLGLSAQAMAEALGCDVARVLGYLDRREGHPSLSSSAVRGSLVDVEWDAPVLLLLESVRSVRMTATVWREGGPTGGSTPLTRIFSASSPRDDRHSLGSMVFDLGDLLNCQRLSLIQEFPLQASDAGHGAACLKLRLQIRPLLPPPAADSTLAQRDRVRRKTLGKGLLPLKRPSVLARADTKEACLFCEYHTPDHSSDSDSESGTSEASSCKALKTAREEPCN